MADANIDFLNSLPPAQRDHYLAMRGQGESHNIAMMCSTGRTPAISTDSTFMEGRWNGAQFAGCPQLGQYYQSRADQAGVSTTGKAYISGLAKFPGDPRAWVSGKSDVREIARERNYTIHGCVEHKGHEVERPADLDIDRDILRDSAIGIAAETGLPWREAVDKAYSLRTGRCDPNPAPVEDNVPHPEEVCRADGDIF